MKPNALYFAVFLALGVMAHAGDDEQNPPDKIDILKETVAGNAKMFAFDYGIPSSPAITLAGLAGDKIKTSTSLKPFVLALPGLFNGTSDSAALDISPAALYDGSATATADYWDPDAALSRVLSKARIGVALYRGDNGGGDAAKAKPSRLSAGISFGLLPSSDPLMVNADGFWSNSFETSVWGECLRAPANLEVLRVTVTTAELSDAVFKDLLTELKPQDVLDDVQRSRLERIERKIDAGQPAGEVEARKSQRSTLTIGRERIAYDRGLIGTQNGAVQRSQSDAAAKAVITKCIKNASAAAEHALDLQVGLGAVFSGKPGAFSDFNDTAAAMWASLRVPLRFLPMPQAVTNKYKPWDYCGEDYRPGFADMLTSCWTFGGSGRVSLGEVVQTGVAATPAFKANILEGWVGLERVSTASKVGGYVGYLDQSAVHAGDKAFAKHGIRYYLSAAIPLSGLPGLDGVMDGTWLEASYGAAHGSVTTLDDKVAMLTLSFAPPSIGSTFVSK